ncbi:hypothetical protein DPV78_010765 [Talaromyces pinophilus]|nr:hypothetical protein DPV78_010765 [Talaromyces pinophilus]
MVSLNWLGIPKYACHRHNNMLMQQLFQDLETSYFPVAVMDVMIGFVIVNKHLNQLHFFPEHLKHITVIQVVNKFDHGIVT